MIPSFLSGLDFTTPWVLTILPLALLPLIHRQSDNIGFPALFWLPADSLGPVLRKTLSLVSVLCLAALIIALAGPGNSQTDKERIGRGAELLILMDRSASMDAPVRRHQLKPGEQARPEEPKSQVVRQALSWLVNERPQNRYALTLFNVSAIPVAPFSDDDSLIQAGLAASGIGRGPNKTNMGLALVSAIEQFDNRSYSGSRAILLVSDGVPGWTRTHADLSVTACYVIVSTCILSIYKAVRTVQILKLLDPMRTRWSRRSLCIYFSNSLTQAIVCLKPMIRSP